MSLNTRMTALLKVAGITHADLAQNMGLSTRQITRVVSETSQPNPDTIKNWCQTLGIDPSVVMADSPSMMDIVLLALTSLTNEERTFVLKYMDLLNEGGDK